MKNGSRLSVVHELISPLNEDVRAAIFQKLTSPQKALVALSRAIKTQSSVLIIQRENEDGALEADLNFLAQQLYPQESILIESFPAWEELPFAGVKPSSDVVGSRFNKLKKLNDHKGPSIVLISLGAFLQKVVSRQSLCRRILKLEAGKASDFETLVSLLREDLGYEERSSVTDKGEFAVRGGIIDIFPTNEKTPYRLDFFGNQLELIKTFNPLTQKSSGTAPSLSLLPSDEQQLLEKEEKLVHICDYMQGQTELIIDDIVQIEEAHIAINDAMHVISPLMFSLSEAFSLFSQDRVQFFSNEPVGDHIEGFKKLYPDVQNASSLPLELFGITFSVYPLQMPLLSLPPFEGVFDATSEKLKNVFDLELKTLFFVTATSAERVHLTKALETVKPSSDVSIHFLQGTFSRSLIAPSFKMGLISYAELTEKEIVKRETWRQSYQTPTTAFHKLEPGDLVVHLHSGIGKFLGFEKQTNHLHEDKEFMVLSYAEGSKLFVPLSQSHLVSRYIGTQSEVPMLTKLGSKKWTQAKAKAQQSIVGYAKELLELEAKRQAHGGFVYGKDSEEMQLFEEDFPYTLTIDQQNAINDIKEDMRSQKAMDRLICGDVGYGKTEVAMRAAFKAVVDGEKQVAVMVPTTVLASQHFDSFYARMKDFPVNIALLTRMVSKKKAEETLEKLANGQVDIVIGTHRLASQDVQFKDLGMLIIDEEQRFGVRTKEHLKKLKLGIDCLTLSATPIPRTLYSSLISLKSMSQICTPPQDRIPIKTVIAQLEDQVIEEGLLRELARGGKAFFIHNRVESILTKKAWLEKLVPHAKIAVGHGQMPAKQLDTIFHEFKHGDTDILLATTIVENGVDIPKANTIFIDRADTYGVADLYQLRGRVGRWKRLAYAYFLVPKKRELSEEARARLHALIETSGFGGGMKLAMRDLEIRGAGDILGVRQSGMVASVGFHFYCKMLKKTILELKKGISDKHIETIPSIYEVKVESEFPAQFSPSYINHNDIRLEIYHRVGDIETEEELAGIEEELIDRFGPMPMSDQWFFAMARLRLFAASNKVSFLKMGKNKLTLHKQVRKQLQKTTVPMPKVDKPGEYVTIAKELIGRILQVAPKSAPTKSY